MSRTGIVTCLAIGVVAAASLAVAEPPLAEVRYFGTSVEFSPTKWGHGFLLRVVAPDGSVVNKTVKDGVPSFDLSELKGPIVDGRYKYELRLIMLPPRGRRDAAEALKAVNKPRVKIPSLSGSFLVSGGSIVSPVSAKSDEPSVDLSMPQGSPDTPDYTFYEDLVVKGRVDIVDPTIWGTADLLRIESSITPNIRLDQNESAGYQEQSWSILANEKNMSFHDITNGVIRLILCTNGRVGVGTPWPAYQFEVKRSGVNSNVVVTRYDGATNYINATASFGNFGTVTDHPLRLVVNSAWQMRINKDCRITMANGASLTAAGVWTDASSRALKKDIKSLSIEKAIAALADLDPVEFAFKSNGERHVGFIAEDVPELVAGADRNGLSPMDVVAVLTRVVQQQQIVDLEQKKMLQEQQEINNELRARISALESQ